MFLVREGKNLLFFHKDPRHAGFNGRVEEDVVLYYPEDVAHGWPEGERRPEVVTGVSPQNRKLFQVFPFDEDRKAKGYVKVGTGTPLVFIDWQKYLLRRIQRELMPEHAKEHVAINLESGEYVLGKTAGEAFDAFVEKWPTKPMYRCRVDGSASIKFHR